VSLERAFDALGVFVVLRGLFGQPAGKDAPLRKRLEAKGRRPGAALLRSYI
jgi:hypothetical protein